MSYATQERCIVVIGLLGVATFFVGAPLAWLFPKAIIVSPIGATLWLFASAWASRLPLDDAA